MDNTKACALDSGRAPLAGTMIEDRGNSGCYGNLDYDNDNDNRTKGIP